MMEYTSLPPHYHCPLQDNFVELESCCECNYFFDYYETDGSITCTYPEIVVYSKINIQ